MTKNHVPSWCNFFQARALGKCGATLNLRAVDVNGFLTYRLSIALVPGRASTSCSSPGQAVAVTSAVVETRKERGRPPSSGAPSLIHSNRPARSVLEGERRAHLQNPWKQ